MDEFENLEKAVEQENVEMLSELEGAQTKNSYREDFEEERGGLFAKTSEIADHETLCAALDGILLVHTKPITYEKLSQVLGISMETTEQLVLKRRKDYDNDSKCGMQIAILEKGIQLATKAKISSFIQRLEGQKLVSLSLPALETLSVIAFKQPITKAEVDAIRGVNSEGVVNTLLEKKLIYISGEKQVLGKPRLYSTSQDFLYYFGMKSLKELPVPTVDITEALTPEGQKPEIIEQQKEVEKDFNTSQGFVPIEDKNNELGELSSKSDGDVTSLMEVTSEESQEAISPENIGE